MSTSVLEQAVTLGGGQSAVARACGVKQAHVWYWLRRAQRWPAEHAKTLSDLTGGEITPEQIRPDVFGPPRPEGQAA